MASFEAINYSLRPNKNVQRKLFVQMFRLLGKRLDLSGHWYVGMGSLWFADFILLHRDLGISTMVSIEKYAPDRAEFNRPFHCVKVEAGNSTDVLRALDLGKNPSIVWMDHDSDLRGPVLQDIEVLAAEAASRSVVLVSVNANVGQVRDAKGPNNEEMSPLEALEYYAGDFVPAGLTDVAITRESFPAIVAKTLINAFEHSINQAARGMEFELLLNLSYRDGAPMVTVGGLLRGTGEEPMDFNEIGELPFWPPSDSPFTIDVPLLTVREKAALDRLMPAAQAPQRAAVEGELGIAFEQASLDSYHLFYRQYPLFAEYEF